MRELENQLEHEQTFIPVGVDQIQLKLNRYNG